MYMPDDTYAKGSARYYQMTSILSSNKWNASMTASFASRYNFYLAYLHFILFRSPHETGGEQWALQHGFPIMHCISVLHRRKNCLISTRPKVGLVSLDSGCQFGRRVRLHGAQLNQEFGCIGDRIVESLTTVLIIIVSTGREVTGETAYGRSWGGRHLLPTLPSHFDCPKA